MQYMSNALRTFLLIRHDRAVVTVGGTPSAPFVRLELICTLGALVGHVAHAVVVTVETGRAALAAFASNQAWEVSVQNRLETWQAGADDAGVDLDQSAVR